VFVHQSLHDTVVEALTPLAKGARTEPLALLSQATQAERLVGEAVKRGARVLGTDEVPIAHNEPPRFRPTVLIGASPEMAVCREASFAPVVAVVPFDDETELVKLADECSFGLGASVFSVSPMRALELASRMRVGSVSVNDVIVGTAHPAVPFGGVRQSGSGVTRGEEGLLALTVPQVVTVRRGKFRPHYGGDQPALTETLRGYLAWNHAARGAERRAGFRRTIRGLWRYLRG
jgi:aldehyde dehydrogenase (NAD+)